MSLFFLPIYMPASWAGTMAETIAKGIELNAVKFMPTRAVNNSATTLIQVSKQYKICSSKTLNSRAPGVGISTVPHSSSNHKKSKKHAVCSACVRK